MRKWSSGQERLLISAASLRRQLRERERECVQGDQGLSSALHSQKRQALLCLVAFHLRKSLRIVWLLVLTVRLWVVLFETERFVGSDGIFGNGRLKFELDKRFTLYGVNLWIYWVEFSNCWPCIIWRYETRNLKRLIKKANVRESDIGFFKLIRVNQFFF